jgi:predicted RecA/RadA family phage recombinase
MAKNFHQPGDVITITSAGAVTAGSLVLQGSLGGVALNAAAGAGEPVSIALTGVFSLPKTGSQAWAIGAPIYWTGSACTTVASTNKMIGAAWEIVGSGAGETVGKVRLNGGVVTA